MLKIMAYRKTVSGVIFVGYDKRLGKKFTFPDPVAASKRKVLRDVIWDLKDSAMPALPKNKTNGDKLVVKNHEYMTGSFSTIFMSRNRCERGNEPFVHNSGWRTARADSSASTENDKDRDK